MTDAVCRDPDCTGRHCLIPSCGRHTDPLEQTCVWCLGLSRRWLKAIPDLAAQISRDNDGWPANSPGISTTSSRSPDTPLMGGDRVALIAPGGDGRNARGHDHAVDNQPSDPPSVLAQLESWERDWRETMHLPAAMTTATLTNVTAFLLANLDWASRHHLAFDDFWSELRQLHATMQHATGTMQRPEVGDVTCIDCAGVRLHRNWGVTGLDEQWKCPRCRRSYTTDEHNRAEKDTSDTYRARLVSVPEVATELGITEAGVWMAVKRKKIRCLMTYENRKLFNPTDFRKAGYPILDRKGVSLSTETTA